MSSSAVSFESRVLAAWDAGRGATGTVRSGLVLDLVDRAGELAWPDITVGERNREVLLAHRELFGVADSGSATCACGERFEVRIPRPEDLPDPVGTTSVTVDGTAVDVTAATCRAVAEASSQGGSLRALVSRCVSVPSHDWSPEALEQIDDALAELDPAAIIDLNVVCPECESEQLVPLDPPSFVWSRISAWAEQTLDDVHLLAQSYGWTEDSVLAMSVPRRRHYIERVLR